MCRVFPSRIFFSQFSCQCPTTWADRSMAAAKQVSTLCAVPNMGISRHGHHVFDLHIAHAPHP